MTRKKVYIVAFMMFLAFGLSSCLSDDNFEDLKIEEVGSDSESSTTGNAGEGHGVNPPPL